MKGSRIQAYRPRVKHAVMLLLFVAVQCVFPLSQSGVSSAYSAQGGYDHGREEGAIQVKKLIDVDGDGVFEGGDTQANVLGFRWGLTAQAQTRLMGATVDDLNHGDYTVYENTIPGYSYVGWYTGKGHNCNNLSGTEYPVPVRVSSSTRHIYLCNQRDKGAVQVTKHLVPQNDPGQFNLLIDGNVKATGGDGATTGSVTLPTGTHTIAETAAGETNLDDYVPQITCSNEQTADEFSLEVTVTKNSTVDCTITNTRKADQPKGSITIIKKAEPRGPQVFRFTATGEGVSNFNLDNNYFTKDISDRAEFEDLAAGKYTVTEAATRGWKLKKLVCDEGAKVWVRNATVVIDLSAGQHVVCTYTNVKDDHHQDKATITVVKNVDTDGDGEVDVYGSTDWRWSYSGKYGSGKNLQTGKSARVTAGSYVVREMQKPGYHMTSAVCTKDNEYGHEDDEWGDDRRNISTESFGNDGYNHHEGDDEGHGHGHGNHNWHDSVHLTVRPGEHATCTFTNTADTEPTPEAPIDLTITKTNNRPAPTVIGDTVTYTMVVSLGEESGTSYDTLVTDLPPKGFVFNAGTWTATSSVRGDLRAAGVTTLPTYGSPGQWKLGTMVPGEVVTLTYQAVIGSGVTPGKYPDVAFAQGSDQPGEGATTLANLSLADTPFVGTAVSVYTPTPVASTAFIANKVVRTELVNTGEPVKWGYYIVPVLLVTIAAGSRFGVIRAQSKGVK